MKRRGFLGIMGGAVVAGPGAAKEAVTAASRTRTGGIARLSVLGGHVGVEDAEGPATGGDKSYLLRRIKEAQRIISGQKTDEEIAREKLDDEAVRYSFEIETSGLRSISETSKLRRMRRFVKCRDEERAKGYAQIRLAGYLKELAGMGS